MLNLIHHNVNSPHPSIMSLRGTWWRGNLRVVGLLPLSSPPQITIPLAPWWRETERGWIKLSSWSPTICHREVTWRSGGVEEATLSGIQKKSLTISLFKREKKLFSREITSILIIKSPNTKFIPLFFKERLGEITSSSRQNPLAFWHRNAILSPDFIGTNGSPTLPCCCSLALAVQRQNSLVFYCLPPYHILTTWRSPAERRRRFWLQNSLRALGCKVPWRSSKILSSESIPSR